MFMSVPFKREEVRKWQKLNDNISIDFQTTIGKGSYGIVYRGYSRVKDNLVAIKVVRSTDLSRRQIQTLEALSSLEHPNIMGFYGQIQLNDNTFLVLEYCSQGTLADYIQKGIEQVKVLKLFREIVQGMCYMNARGKMHRDFKPQNILMGPELDIKICDFGLAQTTNTIFVTGKMGTPLYAGPEVFLIHDRQNQTYTNTCDVWSAGLILYEMLMGERLMKDVKNYHELKEEWLKYERGIKRPILKPSLHPLWEYFILRMLQFDYQKRPTFHNVLQSLKKVYDRMQSSILGIQGKQKMVQELRLGVADRYISFQIAKHQVLVTLCEKFTQQDIRISNQYKFICMFICLLRYTIFAKVFIRSLRYKRLRIEDRDLLPQGDQPQIQMFCERARLPLENGYEFYNKQLRNNVVNQIVEKYCKRPQSRPTMQDLEEAVGLVHKFNNNQILPDQHEIKEIFKAVLFKFKKKGDYKKRFSLQNNLDELRLYAHLLIATLLDDRFPESEFQRMNIQQQMSNLEKLGKQELYKLIDRMLEDIEQS